MVPFYLESQNVERLSRHSQVMAYQEWDEACCGGFQGARPGLSTSDPFQIGNFPEIIQIKGYPDGYGNPQINNYEPSLIIINHYHLVEFG